ncbi:MAG TPA: DUF5076 domain-containing protein [Patescibacteria group bacterium]|jgi:hypothetical protein|nr:DUF5076 domain-containing protein [Patescibacteria group bacterium]
MFKKSAQRLDPPPGVKTLPQAAEVLSVWAAPEQAQQVTLRTTWEDPAAWGLMLVDIARHAARAYGMEGRSEVETLARIKQFFDAEWSHPTDAVTQV